jgi:hypothetical protein
VGKTLTMQSSPEIEIRRFKWLDVREGFRPIDFHVRHTATSEFSFVDKSKKEQRNESYNLEETMPKSSCVAQEA